MSGNVSQNSVGALPGHCAMQGWPLAHSGFEVRVATSTVQHSAARMLIERRYASRGYATGTVVALAHSAHRITLEASGEGQPLGTLTLGFDSSDGLLADGLYAAEINAFRTADRKVCELSTFAIDAQQESLKILASLFHYATIYVQVVRQVRDVFIEVNPRHASFYERMMGFHQVGDRRTCVRVNAPAVLMHLELGDAEGPIGQFAVVPGAGRAARGLESYYFSPSQVCDLVARMRAGKRPTRHSPH